MAALHDEADPQTVLAHVLWQQAGYESPCLVDAFETPCPIQAARASVRSQQSSSRADDEEPLAGSASLSGPTDGSRTSRAFP